MHNYASTLFAILVAAAAIALFCIAVTEEYRQDCIAWGYDGFILDGTVLFCFRLCDCPDIYAAVPYPVAKLQYERSAQLLPASAADSG